MTDAEIELFAADGWFAREVCAGSVEAAVAARQRVDDNTLTPAGISRGSHRAPAVRGDASQWLNADDTDFSVLWQTFEALRLEINAALWLGLERFELQLAHYPGRGEGYARHRDAFAGADNRRLTAIVYLNPQWIGSAGGELRLFSTPTIDIAPMFGRLIIFRSAKVEHEVLPNWAPRLAVTAWYSSVASR